MRGELDLTYHIKGWDVAIDIIYLINLTIVKLKIRFLLCDEKYLFGNEILD